ncbi:MAG: hypothetical protein QXO29_04630 [Nitrososphaerota archaeon]
MHKFKIKTIFFIITIISITTILINNSISSINVNSMAQPREYGITRIWFPNGTIVHIEYEALNREVGRNENGIIYETIPESIKIIKYEVICTESASPQAIIYGYRIFTGNPSKTWVYKQVSFGYTFSVVPVVTLGETLAYGEWGHIEDPNNINLGRGVTTTYFWFRAYTNDAGACAIHFIAIG